MSKFKDLREGVGYTQEGLAHAMGVSVSTVRRWERGKGSMNLKLALDLCALLRCSPMTLYQCSAQGGGGDLSIYKGENQDGQN
jgi:DNA-binding XRE family transcriptional regulator